MVGEGIKFSGGTLLGRICSDMEGRYANIWLLRGVSHIPSVWKPCPSLASNKPPPISNKFECIVENNVYHRDIFQKCICFCWHYLQSSCLNYFFQVSSLLFIIYIIHINYLYIFQIIHNSPILFQNFRILRRKRHHIVLELFVVLIL